MSVFSSVGSMVFHCAGSWPSSMNLCMTTRVSAGYGWAASQPQSGLLFFFTFFECKYTIYSHSNFLTIFLSLVSNLGYEFCMYPETETINFEFLMCILFVYWLYSAQHHLPFVMLLCIENGGSILRSHHGAAASGAWVLQGGILWQEIPLLPQSELF